MRDAHQKQLTLGVAAGLLALFGTQESVLADDPPKSGADTPHTIAAANPVHEVRVSMLTDGAADIDPTLVVPARLPVSSNGAAVGAAAKGR